MSEVVRSLFVTLRRGQAGKPWFHRRIVAALGLSRPHDCVEKPNSPMIRGMLLQIPHLVLVETDKMYYYRGMRDYYQGLCRPPLSMKHPAPSPPPAPLHPHTPHTQTLHPPTQHTAALHKEHVLQAGMEGFSENWRPKRPTKYIQEIRERFRIKALTEKGLYSEKVKKMNRKEMERKAEELRTRRRSMPGEEVVE